MLYCVDASSWIAADSNTALSGSAEPVIGKLSQVGAERVLGTILGGVVGFAVYEAGEKFWERRCCCLLADLSLCPLHSACAFDSQHTFVMRRDNVTYGLSNVVLNCAQ